MSHLDTAAASQIREESALRATHFVGSIGRSLTVLDTSVDLSRGDRTDGPTKAQLMLVCEAVGNEGNRRRMNAMAIDSITRELLREDDWMISLGQDRAGAVAEVLADAVRKSSASLAAFQPDTEARQTGSIRSLTLGLVAWPFAAVANVGEGVVVHVTDERLRLPFPSQQGPATAEGVGCEVTNGVGGASPPEVKVWSTELGEKDRLILTTSALRSSLSAPGDELGNELATLDSAKAIVEALLCLVPEHSDAATAVAKLTGGTAGQMQALAEQDVSPPRTHQELRSDPEPSAKDAATLLEDGATP